jgi:hypothetical protein
VLDHLSTPLVPWTADTRHGTWTLANDVGVSTHWLIWKRSEVEADPAEFKRITRCKLYVSPTCDALRDTLHSAIPILADSPAFAFKVGRDLSGMLRPDKMVVYFARYEDLAQTAARLGFVLAGASAQGVPFSAALTADGLLSWGIDPAEGAQSFGWNGGESWRAWVTSRLAASLRASSRCRDLPVPPWAFALASLELEGVEPTTFVPVEGVWSGTGTI